jgi:hypothetical protein
VSKHRAVIEINGKVYDATTGKMITDTNRTKVVDGVMKRKASSSIAPTVSPKISATVVNKNLKKINDVPSHATKVHKKQERTHTLVRSIVKKPTVPTLSVAGQIPNVQPAMNEQAVSDANVFTRLFSRVDESKVDRAMNVPKSTLISRFGFFNDQTTENSAEAGVTKKVDHLPVVEAPVHVPDPYLGVAPMSQTASLLSQALKNAPNHTAAHTKKPTRRHKTAQKLGVSTRFVNIAGGSLLLLITLGIVVYQQIPQISVKLAASKAGVNAKLPAKPSGFTYNGPIEYADGTVNIGFKSNSDQRSFMVSQQKSTATASTLPRLLSQATGQSTQNINVGDKTVYLYGTSNAAWVDNGVLYKIEGNSSLNSSQLLDIVKSVTKN